MNFRGDEFEKMQASQLFLILIRTSVLFTCMQQPSGANAAINSILRSSTSMNFLLNVKVLLYYVK